MTDQGMDTGDASPLGVSCGRWHQDVGSGSFGSVAGEFSMGGGHCHQGMALP